jgi:hypothetical protein
MNPEFGTLTGDVAEAVATADALPTGNTAKVIGKGIYLEMPNADETQTTQVLITPEGISETGKPVAMAITYRTISDWSPRKQWRTQFIRKAEDKSASDNVTAMAEQVENWLKRQMNYGLTSIRNSTPLVFEVTNLDLNDVLDWKVPAPALRRIIKARTTIGFPADLYKTK